ncbi:MAG: DUF1801 domain-containing protein [Candidatus Thermoplasmatota archaeon]
MPSKTTSKKAPPASKPKPAAKPATKAAAKPKPSADKPDWRPETLARVRKLIAAAAPDAVEEVKWRKPSNGMAGVATWSLAGLLCTGETYKDKVKLTFARGAALADPAGLFNAADTGATRRAVDLREGDKLDEKAFKALIRAAVEFNASR